MPRSDLLFEIGTEELPASFVQAGTKALPSLFEARAAALRLAHGAVRAVGTPRRLALLVSDLADTQPDLAEELVGPPVSAAFKDGAPTKAAEAFARKCGLTVAELEHRETAKGTYLAATRREEGRATRELLPDLLLGLLRAIPFRKSMRWASYDEAFGRPVRWLVALYGADVVPVTFAELPSGRTTFGHRFLAPSPIEIGTPAAYEETLRAAHVVVDPDARRQAMLGRLRAAAEELGGTLVEDAFLVEENLSLVEEPHVIVGSFEDRFRDLPEEVILAVAKGHQRYFGVRGADGRLLSRYLAVAGTALRPDLIAKGNDRVMRARLADALFFFREDQRLPLERRGEKLGGIVFHVKLGSVGEKAARIEALTGALAELFGVDAATRDAAVRAARLAKCDLVTLMVGEFPELEGVMGRAYALAEGRDARVADAIRDHYRPLGGHDEPPSTDEAALVGLADRLDSLVGIFGIGLSPTGAADPFALRRAAIAILRTLLARGWDPSLRGLVERARPAFEAQGIALSLSGGELADKLADFLRERLRNLLVAELPQDVVDACLAVEGDRPTDVRDRARALATLSPELRARAGEVWKRVTNIAKQAPDGAPLDPRELEASPHPAEIAVYDAQRGVAAAIDDALATRDHARAFAEMARLAPLLQEYFTHVFVMAEDAKLRDNRLRALRAVRDAFRRVADFQLLSSG